MGKYDKKKSKQTKSSRLTMWVVAACCIALPVAIIAISWILRDVPATPPYPRTPLSPRCWCPPSPPSPKKPPSPMR